MDNKKPQVGTSSSLTSQLFGPQGSSSSDVLASIFPPSKVRAPWENDPSGNQPWNAKQDNAKHGGSNSASNERSSIYQQQGAEPSNLSSSLYYGGRELYSKSPNTNQTTTSYPIAKKDGGEDDPTAASRGNWWQGSLYY